MSKLDISLNLNKDEIEKFLTYSKTVPSGTIIVSASGKFSRFLCGLDGTPLSLALVAVPHPRFANCQGYTIGFLQKLEARIAAGKEPALIIYDDTFLRREREEFRNNRVYRSYNIHLIAPCVDLTTFFREKNVMAPYATPDSC